jgi:hypothetical protein
MPGATPRRLTQRERLHCPDTRDERNHNTDDIQVEKLLDRTGYARENIVRVRANQSQSSDDDHKNHGQHNGIFRDVLALVFSPQSLQDLNHPQEPQLDCVSPSLAAGLEIVKCRYQRGS